MGILFLIVPLGVIVSLLFFLLFENRASNVKKELELIGIETENTLQDNDIFRNTTYFGIVICVFTLIISNVFYSPEYGLTHALMYIFLTTFIGSVILFLTKFKDDLLRKVFSAFLYGATHIFSSSVAFFISYLIL